MKEKSRVPRFPTFYNPKEWHVVCLSGGKDSTAMLLHMIELRMHIEEILFCDTGVEFPQIYEHLDKVENYIGRKITRISLEHSYTWYLLEKPCKRTVNRKGLEFVGKETLGYSFPSIRTRWCTRAKIDAQTKHLNQILNGRKCVKYIGIAADEKKRIKNDHYPLVEWGWTEADCLKYCYDKGFDWGGLYTIFNRLSCWCCPLQRMDECRKLRKHFPELWATLLDWQHRTWRNFKQGWSVDKLEARFAKEDKEG